jgi:hypothetical protein
MNKTKKYIFDNWLTMVLLMSSIVFCYAFYTEYSKNKELEHIRYRNTASTIKIEGSRSNIYVLEDTLTGMVWIGIPGVNKLSEKGSY